MATRNQAVKNLQKTAQVRIDKAIKTPGVRLANKPPKGSRTYQPMPEGGLKPIKGGKGARGQGAVKSAAAHMASAQRKQIKAKNKITTEAKSMYMGKQRSAQKSARKTKKTNSSGGKASYMHPELRAAARRRIMAKGSPIGVKQMSKRIHKRRARKHALGTAKGQQGNDTKS